MILSFWVVVRPVPGAPVIGMFIVSTTATLLVVPLIAAALTLAGVDPVHFGIVVIFNRMIGILTPPMGIALFLISDNAKAPMPEVLKALIPFYVPLFISLAIITTFGSQRCGCRRCCVSAARSRL